MRPRLIVFLASALVAGILLTACGDSSNTSKKAQDAAARKFAPGSTMASLARAGTIKIGAYLDQPGLSYLPPGASTPTGFDIDIAKLVAANLGIPSDRIQWTHVLAANREAFLENGTVNLILAT